MLFSVVTLVVVLLFVSLNNLVLRGTIMDLEEELKNINEALLKTERPEIATIVYKRPERTQEELAREREKLAAQKAMWR